MKKLLYVTNIPTPYRQKRFNLMQEIFPKYDIEFEVLYMDKIEPNRKWIIPEDTYQYNYKFFKGLHPVIGRFYAHFNPGLLLRLLKNDYDIAIIGGMASPTHWLAPCFIRGNKLQVMSIESNLNSVERKTGFGARIKNMLLKKANAYQITGTPQKKYIEYFFPEASKKRYITLPNIIDEEVFRDHVTLLKKNRSTLRKEFNVQDNIQMWVLPAQLIELKGIIPFLDIFKAADNVQLYILGDGPLRSTIESYVNKHNLPVTLVGHVSQESIVKYYAAADLFALPSLKDASPLTPIEAIAAGLPVLVSSRIGNLEDVIEENVNGWSYDPVKQTNKGKELVKRISRFNSTELHNFGMRSRNRYQERFDSVTCIKKYASQLQQFIDG